jgi:hypothetical protein
MNNLGKPRLLDKRIEILTNGEWNERPFDSIKAGDVFREINNPDGMDIRYTAGSDADAGGVLVAESTLVRP